jgi:carbamoylphosphate synthase small subunit
MVKLHLLQHLVHNKQLLQMIYHFDSISEMFGINTRTLKKHIKDNSLEFMRIGHACSMDDRQLQDLKDSLTQCYAHTNVENTTTSVAAYPLRARQLESGNLPAKPERAKPMMSAES